MRSHYFYVVVFNGDAWNANLVVCSHMLFTVSIYAMCDDVALSGIIST